jgi:DNA-binding NtrC family response regulator
MSNPLDWSKYKVLVVEDEEDLRNILCMFFKRRKAAKVMSACNGEEALKIVEGESVDLVLSDVRMPGTDGVWLLDKLRQRNPEIPVVFLATGFADLSESEAKARGALGLIPKPFSVTVLFKILEDTLSVHPGLKKSG